MIIRKDSSIIFPVGYFSNYKFDIRDSKSATWRDVIASIMEEAGEVTLSYLYGQIEGHKKCENNQYWKEKIRQTLQKYKEFESVERGIWKLQVI